jgi:hypothetical protein
MWLQPLQRERVIEDIDVCRGSPGLWADAAPGTAIKAPPESAAAEPVRNFRREVSDLPSCSLRYAPSLMDSLSIAARSTCPLAYLPLRVPTKHRMPEANEDLSGSRLRHWLRPPSGAHPYRAEFNASLPWTRFVPNTMRVYEREGTSDHCVFSSAANKR